MAYYAYKRACYDIDYEKFKSLVKQFEKEYACEHDGDSNYDGDNWYIMAMWINELRAEVAALKAAQEVPEGMCLVPVEITNEMQEAFYSKVEVQRTGVIRYFDRGYKAMLKAAKGQAK